MPVAFRHLDKRPLVKVSTGIRIVDDPRGIAAAGAIAELNEQLERDWADLAAGRDPARGRRYTKVKRVDRIAFTPPAAL